MLIAASQHRRATSVALLTHRNAAHRARPTEHDCVTLETDCLACLGAHSFNTVLMRGIGSCTSPVRLTASQASGWVEMLGQPTEHSHLATCTDQQRSDGFSFRVVLWPCHRAQSFRRLLTDHQQAVLSVASKSAGSLPLLATSAIKQSPVMVSVVVAATKRINRRAKRPMPFQLTAGWVMIVEPTAQLMFQRTAILDRWRGPVVQRALHTPARRIHH